MKRQKRHTLLALALLAVTAAGAQEQLTITERTRPVEWDNLIEGGRFMDRILPMPQGELRSDVWGAKEVIPRYVDNGIECPELSFWGGNIVEENGVYHFYICGWPENTPKGHWDWPRADVYHATSNHLIGPYTVQDTIGMGYNPEIFRLKDGRYVLYVMDANYVSDSVNGPWKKGTFTFDHRNRDIIEGLSNLTFAQRPDGSYLMLCRGGGSWISEDGLTPYLQISHKRAYPDVDGRFEDPVIWRDELQYHLIVNDWYGRIAYYERSLDGINWVVEEGEAYVPGVSVHEDGHVEDWFKYERAKVFQDEYGRPIQMNFAVIDTIKWEDLRCDNHSSKNISLPLNKGIRMEVLNKRPINEETAEIQVRILGEEGFNPNTDLDRNSLRFGQFTEVNYGRGAKAVEFKAKGKDLIVTFTGKSGITEEEFAPKLLGKDVEGEMVFGYARLPYVNYNPAILSARFPLMNNETGKLEVEIQNFGLTKSKKTLVEVLIDGKVIASGKVGSLKPYEIETLTLKTDAAAEANKAAEAEVRFIRDDKTTSNLLKRVARTERLKIE